MPAGTIRYLEPEAAPIKQFQSLFDVFKPIHDVWWAIFGQSLSWGLTWLYHTFQALGPMDAIGAYGLAIIALTILIKLALSPLYQLQLSLSKKSMQEQRRIAPMLAEVRKKYKSDPQKQQQEMMKLYKEHGVNPLGGLSGCLPSLLQLPILTALYYVFLGNARRNEFPDHFLWVPHLNSTPASHALIAGLPIPTFVYLIVPLLAAATTFVQSKMMQLPKNPNASEQEQQQQQMTQSMQVMMPLMIAYFAIVTPAGLGLYWFISNCFAIIQQYLVNGWGGLRPTPVLGETVAEPGERYRPQGGVVTNAKPKAPEPPPANGSAKKPGQRPGSKTKKERR